MPFRSRLSRFISRNSVSSSSSSSATTSDAASTTSTTSSSSSISPSPEHLPFPHNPTHSIYGPNETIPYKYRRPVAKEHQKKLDSFNFAGAFARTSTLSKTKEQGNLANLSYDQYSPMGSRLPSRRESLVEAWRERTNLKGEVLHLEHVGPQEGLSPEALTQALSRTAIS